MSVRSKKESKLKWRERENKVTDDTFTCMDAMLEAPASATRERAHTDREKERERARARERELLQ